MTNWLIVYLVASCFISIILVGIWFYNGISDGFDKFPLFDIFPPLFKKHVKVNWFGAVLTYTLTLATVPLISMISAFYWLSTIGVKVD